MLNGLVFFFLALSLSCTSVFARTMQDAYDHLKGTLPRGATLGMVCEQLAKWKFSEMYPEPKFDVETGIEYRDTTGRTVGELDLVIFDRRTGNVKLVGETKCKNEHRRKEAKKLASRQLHRLRTFLNLDPNLSFTSTIRRGVRYSVEQFYGYIKYAIILPRSETAHSNVNDLDFSLDQIRGLHRRLVR
jgi:hypothetical protein